jgi:uncharacterized glyoxalase superfamily protein PhnB
VDRTIPELGVVDMDRSIDFYNRLGFEKTMDGTVDEKGLQWCAMQLGDSSVWLQRLDVDPDFRADVPVGNGVTIYLRVDDVDASYERVRHAGFQMNVVAELESHWYGLREFKMCDPDGYTWTFYTPTEEGQKSAGADA